MAFGLLAALLAGCASSAKQQNSFESNVEGCRQQSVADCLAMLDQQQLSGRPRSEVLMSLALSRLVVSDGEGALPYLDAIIEADPGYALAFQNRGTAYLQVARQLIQTGVERDSARVSKAFTLAAEDMKQAITLNPDVSVVYLTAMIALAEIGECPKVKIVDQQFARKFGASDAETRKAVLEKCLEWSAARNRTPTVAGVSPALVTSYDPGTVDMPEHWGPLEPCRLAIAAECVELAKQQKSWKQDYSLILTALALRSLLFTDSVTALTYLDVVATRDPDFPMAYQQRGNAYLLMAEHLLANGHSRESAEVVEAYAHAADNKERAAKLQPQNPSHYIGAAVAYARRGQCDRARSFLNQYRNKFAVPELDDFIPAIEQDCKN